MADLLVEDLASQLGADVTLNPTKFPLGTSALKAVATILQAVIRAQDIQNAAAPTGEDVALVTYNTGPDQVIERNGQQLRVKAATYQLTLFEKSVVEDVYPILR